MCQESLESLAGISTRQQTLNWSGTRSAGKSQGVWGGSRVSWDGSKRRDKRRPDFVHSQNLHPDTWRSCALFVYWFNLPIVIIANFLKSISFPCGCEDSAQWHSTIAMDDIIGAVSNATRSPPRNVSSRPVSQVKVPLGALFLIVAPRSVQATREMTAIIRSATVSAKIF